MKRTTMTVAALLMVAGTRAEIITVNDDADAEIKQHVNYGGSNYGQAVPTLPAVFLMTFSGRTAPGATP